MNRGEMDAIPAFRHTLYYTRFTHFGAIFMYIYGDLREKARDDGTATDPVKSRLCRHMETYGEI